MIHRPEEALDIQSELIFVNGMVQLPQEWNFGTPTVNNSPFTSYTTGTPHSDSRSAYVTSHVHL